MFRVLLLSLSALTFSACNPTSTAKDEANKRSLPKPAPATPASAEPAPVRGALTIDPSRSSISFVGANVLSSHTGAFKTFSGTIEMGDDGPTSIAVNVDTASIFVEHPKLLGHLRTEDFFFVEKFPTASFKSTSIAASSDADYTHTVTGDITIRGVTKPQTFPIRVTQIDGGWRGTAAFDLKRMDFNVAYKGAADNLVKTKIPLTLELVATKSS